MNSQDPSRDTGTPPGTWPLFTYRGIRVFLHWSWILVAVYHINKGKGLYPHIGWDILEYLTLFAIVLTHEFGHAFATRQVGGTADRILLWPFGGIAFVRTPPRPGAYLWGIAAGPLVNVALWPVLYFVSGMSGLALEWRYFFYQIYWINTLLLLFNLLPAYPLDGGQILRGLLWLKLGPVKSIEIAAWIGLVLGGAAGLYAIFAWQAIWLAIMMGLIVHQSWMAIEGVRQWRGQSGGRR
jgi:Zn-dependent protease